MNDVNVPQGSSSSNPYVTPHKNSLEDTLRTFMQGQIQINKNVMKTLDELKTSIVRIESRLNVREKGTLPSRTQPNSKGQFEVKNSNLEQANVVTTLRSGKVIETPMKLADNKDILDVFQQVKINIPLLSVIKQVLAYAKFLKDLCTVKRKHNVQKKAFLAEQVSSILQHNTPPKYKDPGCPNISCIIGDFMTKQALLDLGARVNLLPFSVYEQLGLGELKPTSVTLKLADRSVKVPRGVVENVLIQIDKFYYPMDFIVLDTQPVANASKEIPVILGRPFLATANALINCRTGIMNLSFGNMTVELNIFDACKDPGGRDDIHEVNMIETCVHEKASDLEAKVPLESCFPNLWDFDEDGYIGEVNSSLNSSLLLETDKWQSRFESLQISETEPLSPSVEFPKPNLNPLPSELNYEVLV
ncbi:uncharacterized protein LOC113360565 [Papaver somniferum]|uniref:uncharacterized protein LOC113360565 n=1 Tax=Papaver somniferum TaxID=3469 RepID=UPI000E6FA41D|nr:uncharacterized protein LOC113360565 [Papaver somniferum]